MEHKLSCITNKTNNETLNKIHIITKTILDEVVKVCDDNDIEYFLFYGALLGAVRHKGFIPWDDDVDIAMTRDNYEKFQKIANEKLAANFVFEDICNRNYPFVMGKVMLKGTVSHNPSFAHLNFNQGIFIDIFPLDNFSNDLENAHKLWKKYSKLNTFRVISFLNPKKKRQPLKQFLIVLLKPIVPKKSITKAILKQYEKCNAEDTGYVGSLTEYPYAVFKKSDLFPLKKLSFEGSEYFVPNNYDAILREQYGDYMELPPEEQRHHHYTEVDLGNYFD